MCELYASLVLAAVVNECMSMRQRNEDQLLEEPHAMLQEVKIGVATSKEMRLRQRQGDLLVQASGTGTTARSFWKSTSFRLISSLMMALRLCCFGLAISYSYYH